MLPQKKGIRYNQTKIFKIIRRLCVKSSTNTCLLYMETGRFPFSVFYKYVYCEVLLKIMKSDHAKLISAAYSQMMLDPDKYAWIKYTRDLLCSMVLGKFGNINL